MLDTLNAPADAVGVNFGEWETAISKDKTRYLFVLFCDRHLFSSCTSCHCHGHFYLSPSSAEKLCQGSNDPALQRLACNCSTVKNYNSAFLDPYEDYDEKDWNEAATKFSFLTSLTLHDDIHTLQTTIMKMDKRFDDIDKKFEVMDKRFDDMDKKRFEDMDKKFEVMDKRFEDMDKKFDKRFEDMDKKFDKRFEDIDGKFSQIMALLQPKPSPT